MISMLVGLGNPGVKYQKTRHNAGFLFADRVVERFASRFSANARFLGDVAKLDIAGQSFFVLKPSTFMNRSGQSVSALARYHNISPDQILVIHDELDLPPGVVRLKKDGGHGGHNGLKDIVAHLGTRDFYRLRIGIGHPGDRSQVTNYVLSDASRGDAELMDQAMGQAMDCLPEILRGEFQKCMQQLHA